MQEEGSEYWLGFNLSFLNGTKQDTSSYYVKKHLQVKNKKNKNKKLKKGTIDLHEKHENKILWSQRDKKKKSKHETHLQSMQEKLNLSEGIEWGVEEDLDRST